MPQLVYSLLGQSRQWPGDSLEKNLGFLVLGFRVRGLGFRV